MTDWSSLSDAYGAATEVPTLLGEAEAGSDDSEAWNELWGRLCHQGSVYTASYAALPALLGIAQRHPGGPHIAALSLAGAIIASNDGPRDPATVRSEHAGVVKDLRDIALENLPLAPTDAHFVYGLEALMAFEDRGPWQRNLNYIADGELPLECPRCGEYLRLDLERAPFMLSSLSDGRCRPTATVPAGPEFGSDERRVLELVMECNRRTVAEQLRHTFGEAVCPCCRATFGIPGALA